MRKYDFIKTIAVISCEEADAEVLCKVPKKKRYLKRDISKIENSLNHSVYYIQTDSNRKMYIVFNVSLQFNKESCIRVRTLFVCVCHIRGGWFTLPIFRKRRCNVAGF